MIDMNWEPIPFDKLEYAGFLLTNIHILELNYLNSNTVKAVKNMLKHDFKCIYDPKIYITTNYGLLEKIGNGKVITFDDFNIEYNKYTNEELIIYRRCSKGY